METANAVRRDLMHDLRMPLQIMCSCAQMIEREIGEENAAARAYAEMLMENARDVQRMLANYLEDERASAQKFRPEAGDIVGCVRTLCRGWQIATEMRDVNLTFCANCAELRMTFDAEKIARILRNLLANALRHTPPGGNICVRFDALGDFVEMRVEDTGEGIPAEELGKIFDPAHTGGGMGLGIARRFAQMHGGELRAESRPGEGSAFTLRLPVGAAQELAM